MKKVLTLFLATIAALISCTKKDDITTTYNSDGSPITQAQALEIVKETTDEYQVVFASKAIEKKGTGFHSWDQHFGQVPCDSWVIIINTNPRANSGRFWLYIYVDPYSGNAETHSWEWDLPIGIDYNIIKYDNGTALAPAAFEGIKTRSSSVIPASDNWAVIISGGQSTSSNYERYWNDCSAIYKCLRQVYNYRKERILVLMSDGTSTGLDRQMNDGTCTSSPLDLDGDGVDDINYSATRSNLSSVFNYLGSHVDTDEQVLIFVTDHGLRVNNESSIVLWGNEIVSASEFANEVNKIPNGARKHVVLGQCYSGGFIGPLSTCDNISVATASSATECSFSGENLLYDEFLYHWISAAAGRTPEGTVVNAEMNYYTGVSVEEIFRFAEENDEIDSENPQYSSSPAPMGEKYGLSGEEFGYPVFSGPLHLSSNIGDHIFEFSVLPQTYVTTWSSTNGNTSLITRNQSSVYAAKSTSDAMAEDCIVAELTTPYKTYSFSSNVYLWSPNINFTNTLICGSLSQGSFWLPFNCPDVSSYEWRIDGVEYEVNSTGSFFIDFTVTGAVLEEYSVSVSFDNPLGSRTEIVRIFSL